MPDDGGQVAYRIEHRALEEPEDERREQRHGRHKNQREFSVRKVAELDLLPTEPHTAPRLLSRQANRCRGSEAA